MSIIDTEKAGRIDNGDSPKTESPSESKESKDGCTISASEVLNRDRVIYDPKKEKLLTRLGLNSESFKRAPASTWQDDEIKVFDSDNERFAQNVGKNPMLQQKIKTRHMQMIAVGGSIATGLFVGSGKALAEGGPAALLICWSIIAVMLLNTMQAMGELAIMYPVSGGFYTLTTRFVDPAWGFAMGWIYVLQWCAALPLELTAAEITIRYWTQALPSAFWITLFFLLIIAISVFGTVGYAEEEFWTSVLRLLVVIMFVILGVVLWAGGGPQGGAYSSFIGGKFWQDPGPFANGFKGVCSVFITAAFSFAGTELVGLAATETKNPLRSLPKAVKMTFWRVSLIYISTLLIIGLLIPWNDPNLLGGDAGGKTSPFVIVTRLAKIKALDHIVNATITISVLSLGCSCIYGGSRTLAALAENGYAPSILSYVDKAGRPSVAVLMVMCFGPIAYLSLFAGGSVVLNWLLALSALSTLFTWFSINLSHIRFRQAWAYHGKSVEELPYRAAMGVTGSVIANIIIVLALIAQFYTAVSPIYGESSAEAFFLAMLALPIVLILYIVGFIWKGVPSGAWSRWSWKRPFAIFAEIDRRRVGPRSLDQIDLITGRRCWLPVEELRRMRALRANQPLYKRIYFWLFG